MDGVMNIEKVKDFFVPIFEKNIIKNKSLLFLKIEDLPYTFFNNQIITDKLRFFSAYDILNTRLICRVDTLFVLTKNTKSPTIKIKLNQITRSAVDFVLNDDGITQKVIEDKAIKLAKHINRKFLRWKRQQNAKLR